MTLIDFGIWLRSRGNREASIGRKLKYFRHLKGSIDEMARQILEKPWCDKSKVMALATLKQYAQFKGLPFPKVDFKAYGNVEPYVRTPEMVRHFIHRVRKPQLKAMIMLALETGATAFEVWSLRWKDINLASGTVTITGTKGHKTRTYRMRFALPAHFYETSLLPSTILDFIYAS
ncbi:tyrosine-type recombinase/integrase [Candidatus Bathyarchaeota archaeon]|nr:tyrosine-type recombinase/integrase [Candidatus Bathyarchaeota archaeon]